MVFLLMFPQLGRYAKVALAAGMAVQCARLAKTRATTDGFARRSLPWMTAAIAIVAVGTNVARLGNERWQTAHLAAAPSGAPNVLLLILDTVRAQSLGLYGNERPTSPNLDRLARRGATFALSLSPSPWTLPAHASVFTARHPHELSTGWKSPLDSAYPTVAEVLQSAGYRTAGFVGNVFYTSSQWGLSRGFLHYEDFELSLGQVVTDSALGRRLSRSDGLRRRLGFYDNLNRKSAEDIRQSFLGWLDHDEGATRPFFAFLNYFDAHEPYLPADPYRTMFGSDSIRRPGEIVHGRGLGGAYLPRKHTMEPAERQAELDAYEASIAYLDDRIGALMDDLERSGVLDNTVVIITSDHGEQFGEHDMFAHGNSLFTQAIHVPLLISYPPVIPPDVTIANPVSLMDLPATILDLVGLEGGHSFPGSSLASLWTGAGAHEDGRSILGSVDLPESAKRWSRSIVDDGMHYSEDGDGTVRLFDWMSDPQELVDLATGGEHSTVLEELRDKIVEAFGKGDFAQAAPAPPKP